jgi:hypothetical protein
MAKQTIFLGNTPNDRTGDPLRTAFEKVNDNFDELYARTNDDIQIPALTGNNGKVLTVSAGALSWVESGSGDTLTHSASGNTASIGNNAFQLSIDNNDGSDILYSLNAQGMMTLTPGEESYTDAGIEVVGSSYRISAITSVSLQTANSDPNPSTANNATFSIGKNGGTVTLTRSGGSGWNRQWTFGTDGNLTLPSGGGSSSFTATTSTGVGGNSKEFASGGAVDSVTTSWTATGGGIVGTAAITNVTVGLSFTFVTFDQSFTATGPITFSSGENNTSGAIHQRTTRTVTQGITTVEADTSGIVFSANAWQTGFKLVIMVETRLDDNVDNVDHTQVCEAIIAANYNSNTEPSMSVYGLTYTSPNPLATFTVQRTGYTSGGSGTIEVIATNVQTQYDLQVSVHAVQFGSSYD